MSALLQFSFEFSTIVCYKCQISFAVPTETKRHLLASHETFWCPAGHSQCYKGETEEQRLRKRLEWKEQELTTVRGQRDHYERSANTYKGKVTRIKNRVSNGVCPCCNRTFQNLMKHMKHQHPTWKAKK